MNNDIPLLDVRKQSDVGGAPTQPPTNSLSTERLFSSFGHDRCVECSLILSMVLYYVVGNANVHIGHHNFVFSVFTNPLASLPFLLIFAAVCWYRLPFAVALLPLSLPYYLQQKVVFRDYKFSLVEITLVICVLVALLQILVQRKRWPYWSSLRQLRDYLGPFVIPTLLFLAMAAFSIVIAFRRDLALRAFREEVFDPLVYVVLALACLRTRQDVSRLMSAMIGTGLIIASIGLIQGAFFRYTLNLEDGVRRISAVYGSANSIGLLFDYVLPLGFALLLAKISIRIRLLVLLCCLPMLVALYLTQSLGAWVAIMLALLFVVAFALRSRKLLLMSGGLLLVVLLAGAFLFRTQLKDVLIDHHTSESARGVQTVSTVTKRIYLWESALRMIHDSPWVGYGMDNWLCHYSQNTICNGPYHYWIEQDPVTHEDTGLKYEPFLSHPHNIFLQVWVSIGIFGLLGFLGILVLFFWLFARIIRHLDANVFDGSEYLRCLTVGVGAAMFAALVQGLVDSSFLEQDLTFCFWILVITLLLLRVFSNTPWGGPIRSTLKPVGQMV